MIKVSLKVLVAIFLFLPGFAYGSTQCGVKGFVQSLESNDTNTELRFKIKSNPVTYRIKGLSDERISAFPAQRILLAAFQENISVCIELWSGTSDVSKISVER